MPSKEWKEGRRQTQERLYSTNKHILYGISFKPLNYPNLEDPETHFNFNKLLMNFFFYSQVDTRRKD